MPSMPSLPNPFGGDGGGDGGFSMPSLPKVDLPNPFAEYEAPQPPAASPQASSDGSFSTTQCDYPGCVDGRVMGGIGAVELFKWWPIKVGARTRLVSMAATPHWCLPARFDAPPSPTCVCARRRRTGRAPSALKRE